MKQAKGIEDPAVFGFKLVLFCTLGMSLVFCNEERKNSGKKDAVTVEPGNGTANDPLSPKPFDPKDLKLTFDPTPVRRLSEIPGLESGTTSIRPDLIGEFCIHVYKLPLKSDFNAELGYFCDPSKKPTKLFTDIDKYLSLQGEKIQAVDLLYQVDGPKSKSVVIGVSQVPIPPKFVKEASIPIFMVGRGEFGYFIHDGKVVKDESATLRGTLQFGKYELFYETKTSTKDGKTFSNKRSTEVNSYQTKVGEPDIGIATEHLIGASDGYSYYKTITIIIANNAGGSVIISMANVEVQNNGYPDESRSSAIDSGTAQSTHVHDGVLKEKADRVVK
jgi:hypothetical protein